MEAGKKQPCKYAKSLKETGRQRELEWSGYIRLCLQMPAEGYIPPCADACAVVRIKVSGLRTWSVRAESGPRRW